VPTTPGNNQPLGVVRSEEGDEKFVRRKTTKVRKGEKGGQLRRYEEKKQQQRKGQG